jgi:hypothetical protein
LLQKLDSFCDTCNLVDANNDDMHVSLSCYESQNDDLVIFLQEPYIEDDKIGCFEKHTKELALNS